MSNASPQVVAFEKNHLFDFHHESVGACRYASRGHGSGASATLKFDARREGTPRLFGLTFPLLDPSIPFVPSSRGATCPRPQLPRLEKSRAPSAWCSGAPAQRFLPDPQRILLNVVFRTVPAFVRNDAPARTSSMLEHSIGTLSISLFFARFMTRWENANSAS